MKLSKLFAVGLIALAALLGATEAHAQDRANRLNVKRDSFIGGAVVAADTDVAMLIKRIDGTPGYVTVSAAGDILLEQTDTSTADTNIECDASIATDGSRNGTIDVSVAACDTMQEVCDIINSQGDNEWACVILDALGTDQPGPSGTGFILAESDKDATGAGGYQVKFDSSAALTVSVALVPPELRLIESYYTLNNDKTKTFNPNPYLLIPEQPYFVTATGTTTYGSGTSTWNVYSVKPGPLTGTYTYATSQGSTTSSLLYSKAAGATTAASTLDFALYLRDGLPLPYGEKQIVRITNSAAMTAAALTAAGQLKKP